MSTDTTATTTGKSSLIPYNTSPATYLSANPGLTHLVTSALIIHDNRVLLIQRAAHDGFPLKWECPGGGTDAADESILHALCREVREETGLTVEHVTEAVDMLEFDGGEETRWRKITFLVRVVLDNEGADVPVVKLDAEEHVDAVWASEADVRAGRCEGRDIEFAYEAQRGLVLEVLWRLGTKYLKEGGYSGQCLRKLSR